MQCPGPHRPKNFGGWEKTQDLSALRRGVRVVGTAMARLKQRYQEEVIPAMMKEFGYKNPMQVPRLAKITLNVGVGEATQNIKAIDIAVAEITAIAGQKAVV